MAYKSLNRANIFTSADRNLHQFQMIDNYIYLYHVKKHIVLPAYPEDISDSTSITFAKTNPLARSAPIYSFTNAGPRTVQCRFTLHREMMNQINYNNDSELSDDYVDSLIKYLQAAALPAYSTTSKMVNPPIVALKLGADVYIKGVIAGNLGINYKVPIMKDPKNPDPNAPGKYSIVDFQLTIEEIDPYDAKMVMEMGSYRSTAEGNHNLTLERGFY